MTQATTINPHDLMNHTAHANTDVEAADSQPIVFPTNAPDDDGAVSIATEHAVTIKVERQRIHPRVMLKHATELA